MTQTLIAPGEKIHVITRRNFVDDLRRHFAGTVRLATDGLVRAQGYTFVFNANHQEYRRRPEVRTRVFDLGDTHLIVNVIPEDVDLEKL